MDLEIEKIEVINLGIAEIYYINKKTNKKYREITSVNNVSIFMSKLITPNAKYSISDTLIGFYLGDVRRCQTLTSDVINHKESWY